IREPENHHGQMKDVSVAGLCCHVEEPIRRGSQVEFSVPAVDRDYCGRGTVVWCHPVKDNYQLGIQFNCPRDAFRARMVEQLSLIEHYRREVEMLEGRCLDGEQAAAEWISRYAEDFARRFPD